MTGILLTPYQGSILGPIANYILGPIMNAIFSFLDFILGSFDKGLIGLSIILFTIVIYLILMPLTIKQQKFSKLSAKMNPELQVIQAKYKDKKDNDSMMAMNAETKAVYAKYGVSPSGSCVQLLIQMPILFALYRVIYSMPAYVPKLKAAFEVIANNVINSNQIEEIKQLKSAGMYIKNFDIPGNTSNAIIDVLNNANIAELTQYAGNNTDALTKITDYNTFLGLNIANSPSYVLSNAWNGGNNIQWLLVIGALAIPLLAAITQWLNTKLMPQATTSDKPNEQNSMAQSMKMMNTFMPIMSAVFCFSMPSGMGLYWIAGAVVRSIQQVVINKHIDKMDIDDLIKKNEEKAKQKMIKAGVDPRTLNRNASINTKAVTANKPSMSSKANVKPMTQEEKDAAIKSSTEYYNQNAKAGSIAAKANMVKQYNEKNTK